MTGATVESSACGFPELNGKTSKAALLENKLAVWKIGNLDATRFTIQSMLDSQRCLIFGANGDATHPERYNWGHGLTAPSSAAFPPLTA